MSSGRLAVGVLFFIVGTLVVVTTVMLGVIRFSDYLATQEFPCPNQGTTQAKVECAFPIPDGKALILAGDFESGDVGNKHTYNSMESPGSTIIYYGQSNWLRGPIIIKLTMYRGEWSLVNTSQPTR